MSPASRMLSAISFGVLRRSAPSTSAIIRSRNDWPGSCVTSIDEPVGEQPRAAGDRRAVAAGLADHGRRLAGDRGLVDRADALDHLAVGRDRLAGGDDDDVALLQLGRGDVLDAAAVGLPVGGRGRPGRAERVRLGLAAALGDRLREVGEQHGQPEPDRDRAHEPEPAGVAAHEVEDEDRGRDRAPELDDEHHRVVELLARVELRERVADRSEHELAGEDAERLAAVACCGREAWGGVVVSVIYAPPSWSSARLSCRTFTPGSPRKPSERPSVFSSTSR